MVSIVAIALIGLLAIILIPKIAPRFANITTSTNSGVLNDTL